MALPNKTFWVNYNARNYNSTTLTIPKENGQLFNEDLVLPGSVTFTDDHIAITGDKRIHFAFNNTSDNIFNRTINTANVTIIAKVSPTNSTWFFSNRDGNPASQVGYLVALGRKYNFAFLDNYSYTTSTSPMIFTWRCGNGDIQYIAHSDNVVGTPYQSTDWARGEMKNIYFFGGNISSESWAGDFYWLYMSPETLTDAEIQQVIVYNDHLHTFSIDKSNARFAASGGTETVEIEAETTWTASTPSFVSVSPSTGDTGTTQVTISCPSYTGATRREDVITFTDNDDYTLTFKARQNGNSAGFSNIYLGDNNLLSNTTYLGDNAVNTIYLGEEIIYSNGPFVGLKASPKTLDLNNLNPTANITIRSSENWTITDDSTIGGYYTLENYTNGCDGWVPTYDGSLDGGELGEYGLWFEWEYGVSQTTFQEYLDNLAAHGITATGSYCPGARYSIYLNPHATGGPGWLSYSQTTGGTGKTVVTVTASTTQAERTATITVTSANYSATVGVSDKALIMPLDEVWYKTTDNNSMPPKNGTAYIDSNGNNLTFTESFDSESGLWKMKFNGNVYGNKGSLYYNNSNRLVELWLPYGYVRPEDIFIYGQSNFEKFKGDSQAIVDNGNAVVCLVDYGDLQNYVIQAAKNGNATITIPEGVVGIMAYAFYQTTATTVNLPSTITNIGAYSLERSVITTMNCYATTCPTVDSNAWFAVNNSGTLHYPSGSDYSNFTVPSNWTKVGDL